MSYFNDGKDPSFYVPHLDVSAFTDKNISTHGAASIEKLPEDHPGCSVSLTDHFSALKATDDPDQFVWRRHSNHECSSRLESPDYGKKHSQRHHSLDKEYSNFLVYLRYRRTQVMPHLSEHLRRWYGRE